MKGKGKPTRPWSPIELQYLQSKGYAKSGQGAHVPPPAMGSKGMKGGLQPTPKTRTSPPATPPCRPSPPSPSKGTSDQKGKGKAEIVKGNGKMAAEKGTSAGDKGASKGKTPQQVEIAVKGNEKGKKGEKGQQPADKGNEKGKMGEKGQQPAVKGNEKGKMGVKGEKGKQPAAKGDEKGKKGEKGQQPAAKGNEKGKSGEKGNQEAPQPQSRRLYLPGHHPSRFLRAPKAAPAPEAVLPVPKPMPPASLDIDSGSDQTSSSLQEL